MANELTDRNLNRHNLMPTHAVRTKPGILVKGDFYAQGGVYDPLGSGGGPESDFVPKRRTMWPAPTLPEGGVPSSFLKDGSYPLDPNMGMPKNTFPVKEQPSNLPVRIDDQMRPTQLIQAERLALPLMPGEGRRYTQQSDQPLDPSVITEAQMTAKPSRTAFFGEGVFAPTRRRVARNNLAGLGIEIADTAAAVATASVTAASVGSGSPTALSPLQAIAMGPIDATMTVILAREGELKALNPGVFQATVAPYSALRQSLDTYYKGMKADPSSITTNAIGFSAAAATYKLALDTAIKKVNASKPKTPAAPSIAAALPGAVVKTATSNYGLIVLGVGAAVVAGLFVVRSFQKKGRRK